MGRFRQRWRRWGLGLTLGLLATAVALGVVAHSRARLEAPAPTLMLLDRQGRFLGEVGEGIGESMYDGVIHVLDPAVEEKLGGNVQVVPIDDNEKKELEALFKKYGIDQGADEFKSIVPKIYGRHEYVLFKPTHKGRAQE